MLVHHLNSLLKKERKVVALVAHTVRKFLKVLAKAVKADQWREKTTYI